MTPTEALNNMAAIVSEHLADMQHAGRGVSAQLTKNLADESLKVMEAAISPKPEANDAHSGYAVMDAGPALKKEAKRI